MSVIGPEARRVARAGPAAQASLGQARGMGCTIYHLRNNHP
ncbi:MAG TPA: hypothetical protein VI306_00455 [Pyrinomonadaceae bacterium]